jgi:hypothetical protein
MCGGCQTLPKPEDFFQPVSLQERTMQTRLFATDDEAKLLGACADLLLDNGFQIKEAESRLGWINAYKVKRLHSQAMPRWVSATVVARQVRIPPGTVAVRVIFRTGAMVKDPAVYQEFFLKLSQAVFIEAQQI